LSDDAQGTKASAAMRFCDNSYARVNGALAIFKARIRPSCIFGGKKVERKKFFWEFFARLLPVLINLFNPARNTSIL
jgi:hypothetical protein